ncbi:MAG: hypothetical protein NUV69_05115 [Candidatus Curtissbacteria bacterium]|nr:hypothetical protein [Candidatus Curtissbacteria bacterium]
MASKKDSLIENVQHLSRRMLVSLAAIFFIIWIVIGVFVLFIIFQGLRSGAFSGLGSQSPASGQEVQAPTETELPGIGKVNIECVQGALSPESIQKLLENNDVKVLTAEEKQKFDACIVKN